MDKTTTQELLAQAEKLCAQRNVRLTPQRSQMNIAELWVG